MSAQRYSLSSGSRTSLTGLLLMKRSFNYSGLLLDGSGSHPNSKGEPSHYFGGSSFPLLVFAISAFGMSTKNAHDHSLGLEHKLTGKSTALFPVRPGKCEMYTSLQMSTSLTPLLNKTLTGDSGLKLGYANSHPCL